MHAVYVQEYDIVDAGGVWGGFGIIGRTDSAATDEIGAAVRSNRTTTNQGEGNHDHEADDHHAGLR
jgi:hypothetical protein